jgi:chemotaxis protein histidine kinase CheA
MKGAARIIGAEKLSALAHTLEDKLSHFEQEKPAILHMLDIFRKCATLSFEQFEQFLGDNDAVISKLTQETPQAAPETVKATPQAVLKEALGIDTIRIPASELTTLVGLVRELKSEFAVHMSEHQKILFEFLYQKLFDLRLCPFGDIAPSLERAHYDLCQKLGKDVDLSITGKEIKIDRDLLQKLVAPLNHLLTNAMTHGIESSEERQKKSKQLKGRISITLSYESGRLILVFQDDGRGIDPERVARRAQTLGISCKNMEQETIQELLFTPGFSESTRADIYSGRGLGLGIIKNFAQEVGGTLALTSKKDEGMKIVLKMPQTFFLQKLLLVQIGPKNYALPLLRVDRLERQISKNLFQPVTFDAMAQSENPFYIIFRKDSENYALAVDKVIGEKELVIYECTPLLGKIDGILALSSTEDGTPIFVLNPTDLTSPVAAKRRLLFVGTSLPPCTRDHSCPICVIDSTNDVLKALIFTKLHPYDLIICRKENEEKFSGNKLNVLIVEDDTLIDDQVKFCQEVKKKLCPESKTSSESSPLTTSK